MAQDFKYNRWSYEKFGRLIRPMKDDLWFKEHQSLLLAVVNHPEGRGLLGIDQKLPPITEIAKNFIAYVVGRVDENHAVMTKEFYPGSACGGVIRNHWPEFVKIAMQFYTYPEFKLYRHDISGRLAATVSEFNPDADPETDTVDGIVTRGSVDESIATITAGAGTTAADSSAANSILITGSTTSNQYSNAIKGITLYDTSSLSLAYSIVSATHELVHVNNPLDGLSGETSANSVFVLTDSNPASDTALVAADYSTLGAVDFGRSPQQDAITHDDSTYNATTLNASGLANISTTGISKFGVQYGWLFDAIDTGLTWASAANQSPGAVRWADDSLAKAPKLVVTYLELAIPSATFNFTPKVPTINTVAPTILPIPGATFNFTRFAPTIRTTDVAVAVPSASFNFTGQVPTLDLTAEVALSIPSASFNFTGQTISIVLTNTEEEINWGLFDENGDALIGVFPTVKIRQRATGFLLDWSDNTYKAAGGTTPSEVMQEMNAADFPGYYLKVIEMTSWSDGWYLAATTFVATRSQNDSVEFLIKDGVVSESFNSSNLDVPVSSRASATKQDLIHATTDTLLAMINNKKFIAKDGSTWYLYIRNSADSDNILKKAIKDKLGNDITDIAAGILTVELKSSV